MKKRETPPALQSPSPLATETLATSDSCVLPEKGALESKVTTQVQGQCFSTGVALIHMHSPFLFRLQTQCSFSVCKGHLVPKRHFKNAQDGSQFSGPVQQIVCSNPFKSQNSLPVL